MKIVDILLDFIKESNDRSTKVIDFHQPNQMKQLFDFTIPENPKSIQQILNDCKQCLKYQVKTGKCNN